MNITRIAAALGAGLLAVGCASTGNPPAGGRGWIAVSANDGKSVLDNGVRKTLNPAPPDTVALIDLRGTPRLLAEIEVPAVVDGPPSTVAVAPDESYALVTAGKRVINGQLMSDMLV